ncbi:unnamed protein product, partial [Meganyctiphanes norvegica]
MDILECTICITQYDEHNHRARMLPCLHYFCQDCLDQIILTSATPHCPKCRAVFNTHSAEMLPPNFLMDDLISERINGLQEMSLEGSDEDFSAGSCSKHRKCQLYFTCKSHNVKICRDCIVIEHPPSKCQVISLEDELEENKKIAINNLKIHMLSREKNISDLQKIINDARTERQEQKIDNEQYIKNANESIEECLENKNKLEKIHQELISSRTFNEINRSCQEAESILKVSNSIGMSLERNFKIGSSKYFQDIIDQNPDDFVNRIIQGGVTVHTTAKIIGETRFSQLLVKNGEIHLPALACCNSPPAPENTVNVSSLLAWYAWTSTDVYLTLASGGKDLGTVYIKLLDNASATYIRKLCMGTIGPSYRGTEFKGKSTITLKTGDVREYDHSIYSELPPAQPEKVFGGKGTVYITNDTGLGFWMAGNAIIPAVGDVIKGISVLEDAWKSFTSKIIIKDV